ncbi:hypothetical protein AHAS_Ahas08G0043300 [Arachis hypogaea]
MGRVKVPIKKIENIRNRKLHSVRGGMTSSRKVMSFLFSVMLMLLSSPQRSITLWYKPLFIFMELLLSTLRVQ